MTQEERIQELGFENLRLKSQLQQEKDLIFALIAGIN